MCSIPTDFILSEKISPLLSFIQLFQTSKIQPRVLQYFCFIISEIQSISLLIWLQAILFEFYSTDPISNYIYNLPKSIALFQEENTHSSVGAEVILSWIYVIICFLVIIYLGFKAIHNRSLNHKVEDALHFLFQTHHLFLFLGSQYNHDQIFISSS